MWRTYAYWFTDPQNIPSPYDLCEQMLLLYVQTDIFKTFNWYLLKISGYTFEAIVPRPLSSSPTFKITVLSSKRKELVRIVRSNPFTNNKTIPLTIAVDLKKVRPRIQRK